MSKIAYCLIAALAFTLVGCKAGEKPRLATKSGFPAWNAAGINVAAFLVSDDFYNLIDGNGSLLKSADLLLLAHVGIVTTAREYQADFDANEIAADRKYASKKILLSGKVASINKDVAGGGYFSLVGTGIEGVQARLENQSLDRAATIRKGHTVVLVCDPGMRVVGFATASNCLFLSQFMKNGNFTPEEQVHGFFAGNVVLPADAFMGAIFGYLIGADPTTPTACTQNPSRDTCDVKITQAKLESLLAPLAKPDFRRKFIFSSCQNPKNEVPSADYTDPGTCVRVRPLPAS